MKICHLKIIGLHHKEIMLDLAGAESYTPIYFIGQNGSYKSTVIEIIYAIFASYDAPSVINKYGIDYELGYIIHGKKVLIIKQTENYSVTVNCLDEGFHSLKSVSIDVLRRNLKKWGVLPVRIISFYAGENDRIQRISKNALRGYKIKVNNIIKDIMDDKSVKIPLNYLHKRYFHGDNNLIPLLLVKAFNGGDNSRDVLKETCHVESLNEIVFFTELTMKNKKVLSVEKAEKVISGFFPYAKYEIVETPKKDTRDNPRKYYRICYEFNKERDNLSDVYELYDFISFVFDGTIRTYFKTSEERDVIIDDTQLSQGQRQWIKIVGLLSLVNDEDSIVLMDEPDAFMNPVWKYQFHEIIKTVLGGACPGVNLIVTHDPLLINGVPKEQIRIFEKTGNEVLIQEPINDTYGLGIDGILRSSYYGLATTYDQETSQKYYKRMILYSKAINNELTDKSEKRELFDLTKELGSLPVFNSSIDYLYLDFLKAYEESDLAQKEYLTLEEVEEKKKTIQEILRNLFEGY